MAATVRIVDEEAIRAHPAFRELLDWLAVEMEHLDPVLAPNGEDTTRIDLLRGHLVRMLSEGTEHHDWIVAFLDRLERHDFLRAPLERLDQLARERRGGG